MATSAWFDYNTYMANKLAQLEKAEPDANWTMTKLLKTLAENGFADEAGAEAHFIQYGQYEDVAPNKFFNATEYLRAKAADYFNITDPKTVGELDVARLQVIFEKYGMSAWSHYQTSGSNEGINPSNQFDSAKYMDLKLKTMQATDPTMTMEKLEAIFSEYGYSALTHFLTYGGQEGEVQLKVGADGKIPAELAVDPAKQVVSGGTNGKVYTLTEGADTIPGTVFDDVINGTIDGTKDTLNADDSIDGGAGTDTLNITVKGTAGDDFEATGGATIVNVENVNIRAVVASAHLDASALDGVTNVNTNLSTGNVTVTGLGDGVAVGMIGNGKTELGNFTATYANSVTDATLNLMNGVKGGTVTLDNTTANNSITTVTVTSTGGENTIKQLKTGTKVDNIIINAVTDVSFGTADTDTGISGSFASSAAVITVKGAGSVDLNTLDAKVKSVVATDNTGGVDVVLSKAFQSFTGGTGDDTVAVHLGTATTGKLVGGDGDGVDTLVIGAMATGVYNAAASNATGFEVARFVTGSGSATYDVSALKTVTDVEIGALTADLILTGVGNTVTIDGNTTGNVGASITRNTKLASKALTVDLDHEKDNTAVAFGGSAASGLLLANYEALTINSLGGLKGDVKNALVIDSGTTGLKDLKIAGDSALKLTNGQVNVNLDATDFTHKLDYTFVVPTATTKIIGGTSDDIFRTTTDIDKNLWLNGGAGIDELNFSGAAITLVDDDFLHVENMEVIKIQSSDAVSLTAGGYFDNAFKDGVTLDIKQTVSKVTSITLDNYKYDAIVKLDSAAALDSADITITTGAGNDVVSVVAKSLTTADITIATGAGKDTISVEVTNSRTADGKISITGGEGGDDITITGVSGNVATAITFNIGKDESTITDWDSITGFIDGTGTVASGGMVLNFGSAAVGTALVSTEKATVNGTGLVTFKADAGLDFTGKVQYLVDNVTVDHATVVFKDDGNNYWVFNNDNTDGDSLVQLVAGTDLGTGVTGVGTTAGASLITIA